MKVLDLRYCDTSRSTRKQSRSPHYFDEFSLARRNAGNCDGKASSFSGTAGNIDEDVHVRVFQ